jgi:hypothetical protein
MFDEGVCASRRLEELRQMMSVVWECSSDVIVISVRGWDGHVTNMLSLTFFHLRVSPKLKFVPWCLSKANRSLQNTRMRRINHPSNPVPVEDYAVHLTVSTLLMAKSSSIATRPFMELSGTGWNQLRRWSSKLGPVNKMIF